MLVVSVLLVVAAFIILVRALWTPATTTTPASKGRNIVILAGFVLLAGLAVLTLTGRLHWLAAAATAVAPFLKSLGRFIFGNILRLLPFLRSARGANSRPGGRARPGPGTMSREEALKILGLRGSPGRDEIVQAHRRLMQKVHPDHGGNDFLAQQLNAARKCLLDDIR